MTTVVQRVAGAMQQVNMVLRTFGHRHDARAVNVA